MLTKHTGTSNADTMRGEIVGIGSHEKVPESFIEEWGGEWGCPAKDKTGKVLGYIDPGLVPNIVAETEEDKKLEEEMWQEALGSFVAL